MAKRKSLDEGGSRDAKDKGHKKAKHSSSKKHKKEKDRSKSKKRSRDDSRDGDEAVPYFVTDLQNVRLAAEYVRSILRKWPNLKQDLRDLFWKVDSGEAVNIAALPDPQLRGALHATFDYLNLHITREGIYLLRRGQDKILRRIGTVLMETLPDERHLPLRLPGDPASIAPTNAKSAPTNGGTARARSPVPAPRAVSRSVDDSPPWVSSHRSTGPDEPDDHVELEASVLSELAGPQAPRVLGPSMPSEALLDAAANMAHAMRQEGLLAELGFGDDLEVGPSPPADLLAELAGIGAQPRVVEVLRVAKLLDTAARVGDKEVADAYRVLDVPSTATPAEIKKCFWRLSLLIHPDKCDHALAASAFHAVKSSLHALQDPATRAALDAKREAAVDKAIMREVAAEAEAQRQWRIQRGTATKEDLEEPVDPDVPLERDEWMTALPGVKARKPAMMAQKSVTQFSQAGVEAIKRDAAWTHHPGAAGRTAQQQHLLMGGSGAQEIGYVSTQTPAQSIADKNYALLQMAGASEVGGGEGSDSPTRQAAQAPKSLVEKHVEALEREQKALRKKRRQEERERDGKAAAVAATTYQGDMPWRPFDRDMDLKFPDQMTGFDKVQAGTYDLGTRFHKGT